MHPAPGPAIEFLSLGTIEVRVYRGPNVQRVDISPKYRALLAYLALARPRDGYHARDVLAALFWPEYDQRRARANLRTAVSELRRLLGREAVLTLGNEQLRIDHERLRCDVVALESALDQGELGVAMELYRGELLPGMHLPDAPGFERWLEDERTALRKRILDVLRQRAQRDLEQGDPAAASGWYERILEVEPYDEAALCALMEARARLGDRVGAIQAYDVFERRLRQDLELEPTDETRALIGRIRTMKGNTAQARATPVASGQPAAEPGARPQPKPRHLRPGHIPSAILLAIGIVGLFIFARARGRTLPTPSEIMPDTVPSPGIAVLPFTVQGPDLDVLREGMVALLAFGLDGAPGLRAIDNRTVLARWDERVADPSRVDLETSLQVAQAAGARYAVIGAAVAVGGTVRLVASVYRVATGDRLGQAVTEGPVDELLPIVDRLSVDVLRLVLEDREDVPQVNVASLTTESPGALRAYLEGEVQYRKADFPAAIAAYERAVSIDSTFALAHAQLGYAYLWIGKGVGRHGERYWPIANEHLRQAMRFGHRLPERDALLVQAALDQTQQTIRSVPALRRAVSLHPDDAALWYRLADTYAHVPAASVEPEHIERLFKRAIDLDPRNAEYLLHYLELAFWFEPDSARAAERLASLERLAPGKARALGAHLAFDLAFGDPATQGAAKARLPTMDVEILTRVSELLFHPRNRVALAVDREIYRRGDEGQRLIWGLWYRYHRNVRWWGKLRKGFSYLDNPEMVRRGAHLRAIFYFKEFAEGIPIPTATLEEVLAPTWIDSLNPLELVAPAGLYAASRGRWSDYERAKGDLYRRARRAQAAGDTAGINRLVGSAMAVDAYGEWRRGRIAEALALLEDERTQIIWFAQVWLAQLYTQLGRFQDAARAYRSYTITPMQFEYLDPVYRRQLGAVYEALGEYDKARSAYEYFLEYWSDADPELQPMVQETRQALVRLQKCCTN